MRKHPIVEFIKFIILIFVCCTTENPIVIGAFLVMSLVITRGKLWFSSLWVFFVIWVIDIVTVSEGVTALGYRNFHLITMEGVVYGLLMGMRMVALLNLAWTMSHDLKMDKIVVITSYIAPPVSLIISMTIRAVRRYSEKYKEIFYFHKSMENDDLIHRIYIAVKSLSILLDWSLENGLETAWSMKSRKYGTRRRSSYHNIRITQNDICEIAAEIICFTIYEISKPVTYILPEIVINHNLINTVTVLIMCIYAIVEELNENRLKRDFI